VNKNNLPRAILFDFDGTLADSYAAIAASVNHVRAAHSLPPLAIAEVRKHVGRGPVHLMECTVGGTDLEADLAMYRVHHPTVMTSLTHLLPGVADTLTILLSWGIRLGVCSNKPQVFTLQLLDSLGVGRFFEVVVGPEDVTHIKPAPDMLLLALAQLTLKADEILYVGDMLVDILAGKSAGVRVLVVATGSDDEQALRSGGADRVLHHLAELPAILRGQD
jgi:2-phosphoglycolate phosphatase